VQFFVGFFKVGVCEFGIGLQSGTRETPEKIEVMVSDTWTGERS
jgi:hypothetical protein